jgi:hypothetical protein
MHGKWQTQPIDAKMDRLKSEPRHKEVYPDKRANRIQLCWDRLVLFEEYLGRNKNSPLDGFRIH